ncbi:hypothetical protein [Paraglaciecola sp. MB-3u-78]|jgi:hypothetical protein|uniref:hypothetical protein n=1 Tax=Paraglaciecola sp. MB-3u-78 TaxID=2058332 RepID=UPI000C3468BB|nr:hypothetical protein [Paraglaciecola sp. MB-3u-78]PKG99498.1 hypothetical protein CXF95_09715 [Paraglaciecola sp. MB-3u-78]
MWLVTKVVLPRKFPPISYPMIGSQARREMTLLIIEYELATGAPHLYAFYDDLHLIEQQVILNPDKER